MRSMNLLKNLTRFQLDPRKMEAASRFSRTRTAFSMCPSFSAQDIVVFSQFPAPTPRLAPSRRRA